MNLTPVRWIKELKGKSYPQLIEFSDGFRYIVKFKNNPQGTKQIVNEYIGCQLAKHLHLPVPDSKLVSIDQSFIEQMHGRERYPFTSGRQFASLSIKRKKRIKKEFPPPSSIVNTDVLPGIVVFDHWLSNDDRNRNNILLKRKKRGGYCVFIIDQGNCFPGGFRWTIDTLREYPRPIRKRPFHQWILSMLSHPDELNRYIYNVKQLPESLLWETITSLPDDWNISWDEKSALFNHLIRGRNALEDIMYQVVRNYH
ncbi:HipA family kinase [Ammoniphilus sp. YIM 78166]|uniref:HipA family kinase n=1 Tax=Ammoniphilus sp. YIM 78166 TaxID=1644106 RepID=UPI00107037B1|nr:HipA family kinase [Ammoniphilus sp. YIM 78166]